jgi:hypothetical protein
LSRPRQGSIPTTSERFALGCISISTRVLEADKRSHSEPIQSRPLVDAL